MSRRAVLRLFYVGPLLVWMALIFTASTGAGSSKHSGSLLLELMRFFDPGLVASPNDIYLSNAIVRKLAHLSEYVVMAALAIRALQFGRKRLLWWTPPVALAICVLFAASDEIHQLYVPNRTPSAKDVLVDALGALACVVAFSLWAAVQWLERRLRGEGEREPERAAEPARV